MPKSSSNATMLTALFLAIMLAGFGAVAYVSYDYDMAKETELLYTTDSSHNPTGEYYELVNAPFLTWDYIATGQNSAFTGSPYQFYTYNRTAVYSGNDTWTYSSNETTGNFHNQARWLFPIENIENWVISSVNLSFSVPSDTDLEFAYSITYPINNQIIYDDEYKSAVGFETIYSFTPTDNHYYRNYSVPLTKALEILDSTRELDGIATPIFEFALTDKNNDGLGAFAFSMSVQIYGEKIDTWSISDTLAVVIAGSGIVNVSIAVLMLDSVDIGGYVRDLPKRSKKRR